MAPTAWYVAIGASSDLERATMELDGIRRVDLETSDPDHPPELLRFLGALVERCERELGGGRGGVAVTAPLTSPPRT